MNGEIKINNLFYLSIILILIGVFFNFYKPNQDYNYVRPDSNIVDEVNVLIFGDMMLDRNVRNIINKKGFDRFFAGVSEIVKGADIAVANLEGPFTDYPSITASLTNKALQFTFDPKLAYKLSEFGFDILGLANNHTLNFGSDGLGQTKKYIGNAGMIYYGDPLNKDEISTIVNKNGIKIAFIGFHEFNYINYNNVFNEIERLKNDVDIIIVTPHWGIEYEKVPTDKMREWARLFIDSGANIVVGAHPHVIGISEKYNNGTIYYSLGNFVFDQYFSEDTMNGLALKIKILKNNKKINYSIIEIPIRIDRDGVRVK